MATKATSPGELRPISTATLIKRLRRFYGAAGEVFHVARTEREHQLWGPFYVTAGRFNVIVDQIPFLDIRARELGVLKDDEVLSDPRPVVVCRNCAERANMTWIAAMWEAGFALRHLECQSCGQHALAHDPKGGDHE